MCAAKTPVYLRTSDILSVDENLTITLKGPMRICADADIDRVIAYERASGALKLNRPYLQRVKDKMAHLESVKDLVPGFYCCGDLKTAALDRDVEGDFVVRVTVKEGSRPYQQPLDPRYRWVLVDQYGFVSPYSAVTTNRAACVALINFLNLPKR